MTRLLLSGRGDLPRASLGGSCCVSPSAGMASSSHIRLCSGKTLQLGKRFTKSLQKAVSSRISFRSAIGWV